MTVHEGRVQVGKASRAHWRWTCDLHGCRAPLYERYGHWMFWELAQHDADRHAREWHHRPVSHDC